MEGKTCVITGASSGIGKASAVQLASIGARVIMVCRSLERGELAKAEVVAKSGSRLVEMMLADLGSLDSVREFVRKYEQSHDSLHVLLNNAGCVRLRRSLTADGFETTFQVNYLSPFLLTNLLLPLLKRSAPSRIVNVSSAAHYGGHVDLGDLQLQKGYGVMRAYSRSKLELMLFTRELARRLEGTGVTANSLHPGTVATNIWGSALGPASFLGKVAKLFLISPEKGARTQVYLASSPEVEGVSGEYFESSVKRRSSDESYDKALAERLWDASAAMVGAATNLQQNWNSNEARGSGPVGLAPKTGPKSGFRMQRLTLTSV